MRIISGGLQRSGSTWQYNALRFLLTEGFGEVYSAFASDYDLHDVRAVHLVKDHYFDDSVLPGPNSRLFTCFRDLRGAAGSMVRMGWLPDDRATLLNWCGQYTRTLERLMPIVVQAMRYEWMIVDPSSVMVDMAGRLGLSRTVAGRALAALGALRPPSPIPGQSVPHDPVTQLHPGHIGDRLNIDSASRISKANIEAIEDRFQSWFVAHDYPLPMA